MADRKTRILWSRLAELDLDSAHAFLAERSPEAARRLAEDILTAVNALSRQPELGVVARDLLPAGRYRHLVIGRYRLIYRLADKRILLLRVWDTRQDPSRLVRGMR